MEIFFILLFCGVAIWVFLKKYKNSVSDSVNMDTVTANSYTMNTVTANPDAFEIPNTGQLTQSYDGGWILNPNSTFPLTIYGVDEVNAANLKNILNKCFETTPYYTQQEMLPLVAQYNIRCKEIDAYIDMFKPIYMKSLEDQIVDNSEWKTASDRDRDDLLISFKKNAIATLDCRPYCDLSVLFERDNIDFTIDDKLLSKYGYKCISFYFRKKQKVYPISSDHYERNDFENLVKNGLAIRGIEIPINDILDGFTLKELSALVLDLNPPKFTRKANAVEYVTTVSDIRDRLNKVVSLRSLFQVVPLPHEFSSLNWEDVSQSWQYGQELCGLIAHTYIMGGYAIRNKENKKACEELGYQWEIISREDSCPYCKRESLKNFPNTNYPKTPLHVGCRCSVSPILK